jgi:hypothetical protein
MANHEEKEAAPLDDDATMNEKIDDVSSAVTGVATAAVTLQDALSRECG